MAAFSPRTSRRFNRRGGDDSHSAPIDMDFVAAGEGVITVDPAGGIPFQADTRDAVCHSHRFGRGPRRLAPGFLSECRRCPRPGGVEFRDQAGPREVRADESVIPGFAGYHLDTDPDGAVRKSDSLFMEAPR